MPLDDDVSVLAGRDVAIMLGTSMYSVLLLWSSRCCCQTEVAGRDVVCHTITQLPGGADNDRVYVDDYDD